MSGFIRDPDATIPDGPSLEPSGGGQPSVALLVVYRDGIQVIPLQLDNAVTIGRMDPADFRANSRRLSRVHARFLWDGECVTVEDLGSTNGTFVNGRRVRRAVMQADDEVTLGSVVVTLHEIGSLPHGLHGVERHERFLKSVEDEIARSRTFASTLTLLWHP